MAEGWKNVLYYGDNLDVLRQHIPDESVDLVYLDPPFNSNANYNVIFAEHGARSAAQIHAFQDTWQWDEAAAYDYEQAVEAGGRVAEALRAFRTLLGTSDMLAYLSMMAPRLVELRRVMKETACIYLHCDPTASHSLKLLMDAVFGAQNFRNEIIWSYRRWTASRRSLPRLHDVILFYSKTDEYYLEVPRMPNATPNPSQYVSAKDATGKTVVLRDEEGRPVKREVAADIQIGDVWDIPLLSPVSKERLGYPTQKPERLLDRIITESSREGDLVLDPFCGCGTTVASAQRLGRRWIGIDITHLAVGLIKHRLADTYGKDIATTYRVVGEPTDVAGAQQLARDDPFQFQAWALGLVGARVATSDKRGGDKGIDGRLYFHDEVTGGRTKQIVFSVKAGRLVPTYLRDLRGVIDREEAQIGVLLSFEEPSAGMRAEAASAGFYDSPWGGRFPSLQLLTVAQLLNGATVDYPHLTGGNVTHRRAPRAELKVADQPDLGFANG